MRSATGPGTKARCAHGGAAGDGGLLSLSGNDQIAVVCFQVEASLEEGRRHVAPLDLITLRDAA